MALFFGSTTLTGAGTHDFMFGDPTSGPDHSISGGAGSDLIFGDYDFFFTSAGGSPGFATNLTIGTNEWSTADNPDIFDSTTVPHASVYREATGAEEWFSFQAGFGDAVTFDVDYGVGPLGVDVDLVLEIYDPANLAVPLAVSDNVGTLLPGDRGSTSTLDPFLSFHPSTTKTYLLHVHEAGFASGITAGNTYMLNVSHTGQAVTNASPVMGNDTLDGGTWNDTIYGIGGDDTLSGGDGDDVLLGGDGDDLIRGGAGGDFIDGGAGSDTVTYDTSPFVFPGGVSVDLGTGVVSGGDASGDFITGIENVIGSDFNDTIAGNTSNNTLEGGAGGDTLNSGSGAADTLSYLHSPAGVTVHLDDFAITGIPGPVIFATGGDATGDSFLGVFGHLLGSAFADTLAGNSLGNRIDAGAGDDLAEGLGGADTLIGGAGTDTASYEHASGGVTVDLAAGTGTGSDAEGDSLTGFENLTGSAFADSLTGDAGANTIDGGDGDDEVEGGAGADSLSGGSFTDTGIDTVSYAGSPSGVTVDLHPGGTVTGGDATGDTLSEFEHLTGSEFADTLTGSNFDDTIEGLGGNDIIEGSSGDDTIEGGAGADTMNGRGGSDTVSYASSAFGVNVDLNLNTASGGDATGDSIALFEHIIGSAANDSLRGNGGPNEIIGAAGNDTIDGWTNDDTLKGGAGDDTLKGGTGDDTIDGGTGDDTMEGGAGADSLDGGAGSDILSYENSAAGILAVLGSGLLTGGDATGDVAGNFETILGSAFIDTLAGDNGDNGFIGGGGDDIIAGGGGNDVIEGGGGADSMLGGTGIDTLSYAGSVTPVTVDLGTGTASGGDAAGDSFSGFENLTGGSSNDSLTGDAGANTIDGGAGNDTVNGAGGNDSILGGDGIDLLVGGAGNDTIDSGTGSDLIRGGPGADSITGTANATVEYDTSAAGVTVNLATGTGSGGDAAGDTIAGVGHITGSAFDDTLTGNGGNNRIEGGDGADSLDGGAGADTASYLNASSGIVADLSIGSASDGDTFASIENLIGSSFDDTLSGQFAAANSIGGGQGNDTLFGGGGADDVDGGPDNDLIGVSSLTDPTGATLDGGTGTDTLQAAYFSGFGTIDLTDDTLAGFEILEIVNTGAGQTLTVKMTAAQYAQAGFGGIGFTTATGFSTLEIALGTVTDFDLSATTVTGDALRDSVVINGDGDTETITGSAYGDSIHGNGGDDTLNGGGGDDKFFAGAGAESIDGAAGTDTVSYEFSASGVTTGFLVTGSGGDAQGDRMTGVERILGSQFADTISGSGTGLTVDGQGGDDLIFDGAGASFLFGNLGDDTIFGSAGADSINGGIAGLDWVRYAASAGAVTVDLAAGTGTGGDADGDTFTGIENVFGSNLADSITGDDLGNTLDGFGGGDTLSAGAGNDVLLGGLGADSLDGGAGLADTASYAGSNAGVNVGIFRVGTGGHSQGDTMTGIERLVGSGFSDTLVGAGTQATTFEGGSGNDQLFDFDQASLLIGGDQFDIIVAQGGNDTIRGGNGIDSLFPGAGADSIDGGADMDTVSYDGSSTDLTMSLATNTGTQGDAAGDTYAGIENLIAGAGNDSLTGDAGFNQLFGNAGADTINGGAGDDHLYGNPFAGGDGAQDVYVFTTGWGRDLVLNWEDGVDKLHVSPAGLTFADFTLVDSPQGVRLDWFDGVSTLAIHLFGNNAGGTNLSPADIDATDFI